MIRHDNSDVQVLRDGVITDFRIETLLRLVFDDNWAEPDADQLFLEVVREFIDTGFDSMPPRANLIGPSFTGRTAFIEYVCDNLIQGLRLDFVCYTRSGPEWPGDFDYYPNAEVAVSLHNRHTNTYTGFIPGRNLCHAIYAGVLQLCREVSEEHYNQPSLGLGTSSRPH